MKFFRHIGLIMAIIILLGGCDTGGSYEISFETHGGEPVDALSVEGGEAIELPEPERQYHSFEGWYLDEDYSDPADFDTPEASMTLHARWAFDESGYLDALNDAEDATEFESVLSDRHRETLETMDDHPHFVDILDEQRPFGDHDAFLTRLEDSAEVSKAMDAAMTHLQNSETLDMDTLFTTVGQTVEDSTLGSVFGDDASSVADRMSQYGGSLGDFNRQDVREHFQDLESDTYASLLNAAGTYLETNRAVADTDDLLDTLSSMEGGLRLHLASGTYTMESTVSISHADTALLAASSEATILDGGGGETIIDIEDGADNVAFEGLTFRNFSMHAIESHAEGTRLADGAVDAPGLLESGVLNFHAEDAEILRTQFSAPVSAADDTALITLETSGSVLEDNTFMGAGVVPRGISVDATENALEGLTIEDNDFLGFTAEALVFELASDAGISGAAVRSNHFDGAAAGIRFVGDGGFDGILVESNAFDSMPVYIRYEDGTDADWSSLLSDNTFDSEAYSQDGAAYPVISVEDALGMPSRDLAVIEGVVSGSDADGFYLEDSTGAVRVDSEEPVTRGERIIVSAALTSDETATRLHDVRSLETRDTDVSVPDAVYMDGSKLDDERFLRRFTYHRLRLDGMEILSQSGSGMTLSLDDADATIDLAPADGVGLDGYETGDTVSLDGVRLTHGPEGYGLLLGDESDMTLYEAPDYSIDTGIDVDDTAFVLKDSTIPLDITIEADTDDPVPMDGRLEFVVNAPSGATAELSDDSHPLTMVESLRYEDENLAALPTEGALERTVSMMFSDPGLYSVEIMLYDDADALLSKTVHAFEVETSYVTVDFENLADEYTLDDAELPLYLETRDGVPYVDIEAFLSLLDGGDSRGAIALDLLNLVETERGLDIIYDWEDEETGESGSESIRFDIDENTVTVDSFDVFNAAQQSTDTDFGANLNLADYEMQEGEPVVFDLEAYDFKLLNHEGDHLMPFHIANLFFSGSMFDVYYNGDTLYGIDTYQVLDGDVTDTLQDSDLTNETMPETYREATYDYLAFSFDHFYGLKEDQGVDTYYDVFPEVIAEKGGRNHYKALFDSMNGLDDLHSWYNTTGFFTPSYDPSASIDDLGPRSQAFYAADDKLSQNYVCAQQGPSYYDDGRVARVPIHGFDEDTPEEFEAMLDTVSEKGTVEEVIVDLSCNTGGIVGGMLQVLGYMTDDLIPSYNINPSDGSSTAYYYEADIEKYDFEWHIFSSPKTFSAGNMMVQIAKDMGIATIIGQDSAGGAASIKANITPSGAILFMSSTSVSANADYESTEMGIEVDVEIPIDEYFDEKTILEAIE